MKDIQLIPEKIRRLGVYEYKGEYFTSKYKALQKSKKDPVNWNFNNDDFANHDWTVEPNDDLYELYAERARQLRAKYDKIIIYFSGGIDSICVLRAFVDNDIPIDSVIVYGAWSIDLKLQNLCNVEQKNVAIPYLKMIEKEKGIKLPVYLLDTVEWHTKYNEDWIYQNSYNLTPQCTAYSWFDQDPYVQEIVMKGKTCVIRGCDKPRLVFKDDKWYYTFLDVVLTGATSASNFQDKTFNTTTEFFFWSPDCPKLLSKQAHLVAKKLESTFTKEQCRKKFTYDNTFNQHEYYNIVEPIVYGKYVMQAMGEEKPYFYLPKAWCTSVNHKDFWFFKLKNELTKDNEMYVKGINKIKETVDPIHFNKVPNDKKSFDRWIKTSGVDHRIIPNLGEKDPLFGTVGCYSPFYFVKHHETTNKY